MKTHGITEQTAPRTSTPRHPAVRWLTGGLVVVSCGLSVGCDDNVRVIPKGDWLPALEPLTAARVRLNNFSPTQVPGQPAVSAFHVADDSTFTMAGVALPFNIPITRQDPYSFYLHDMRSTGTTVDASGGRVVIRVAFESEGHELVGNCVENLFCICGDPRIDLDDARLDLEFRIGARDNRLVLSEVGARFVSSFGEAGPCRDNACAVACDLFAPNRENQARAAIERQATSFLESQRPTLETLLNAHLRSVIGPTTRIASALIGARGELVLVIPE